MSQIPFLPAAEEEFLRAVDRYTAEAPALGAEFVVEVQRAVECIAAFPEHGSPSIAGTRRVILRRFPFSIIYQAEAGELLVIAVAHHSRLPGYWRDRV